MRARVLGKYLKAVRMVCRPGGATIHELAEALEVNIRSGYRIPRTLEESGVPVIDQTIEGVRRITVDAGYLESYNRRAGGLPALTLSPEEVAGLCWLKAGERLVGKTRLGAEIEAAFEKLDGVLPGTTRRHMARVRRMFLSVPRAPKDYSGKSDILDALVESGARSRTVTITYSSFWPVEKTSVFDADPLHLFERDGGLYLLYNAPRYRQVRALAVERIQSIRNTDRFFTYPTGFDPVRFLSSPFNLTQGDPFRVRVRFSKRQAPFIEERQWHPTQRIRREKDGGILFEMTVSGWVEVKQWVMRYGADAELFQPKKMREEIAGEIERLSETYRADCQQINR